MTGARSKSPVAAKPVSRRVERHDRILDAACRLTGEFGHDRVSMRAIATASGTTEKTLYNIFGSKDRLIAVAARERTATVFKAAIDAAPEGGWAMLRTFARLAARYTLDDQPMARALAAVLIEHADLVGLNQLYEGRVASALDQMAEAGMLELHSPRALAIRMIRLGVISAVLFWAKGELRDDELEPYIVARIAETLLPSVPQGGQAVVTTELAAARAVLARGTEG
jgi:TetR/AcrR family transcriptional regulator, cholesterol catabolism regulator